MNDRYLDEIISRVERELSEQCLPEPDFFLSVAERAGRPRRHHALWTWTAAAVAFVIATGSVLFLTGRRGEVVAPVNNATYVEIVRLTDERIDRAEQSSSELRESIDQMLPFPETKYQ